MIPKYEAIAADIRRSIEDGALKPGDKLPTVVEFCELYRDVYKRQPFTGRLPS